MEKEREPLVPASMRPKYDPATDTVLQAIRHEVLDLLSKPFDGKSLGTAELLIQHATEILQLRRGAQKHGKRRRGGLSTSMYIDMDEADEDDGVLAPASKAETFGSHAVRTLEGTATELLSLGKSYLENRQQDSAHDRALAIESAVRAMVAAKNLPEDVRGETLDRLRREFDVLVGKKTDFDVAPVLVAHEAKPLREDGPTASPVRMWVVQCGDEYYGGGLRMVRDLASATRYTHQQTIQFLPGHNVAVLVHADGSVTLEKPEQAKAVRRWVCRDVDGLFLQNVDQNPAVWTADIAQAARFEVEQKSAFVPHLTNVPVLVHAEGTVTIDVNEVLDTQPRAPGCQCHQEEGDSPCRVHGDSPEPTQQKEEAA